MIAVVDIRRLQLPRPSAFPRALERRKASFALDGTLIVGALPGRQAALVQRWATLHDDELAANWERAQRYEPLALVDPLP